MGLGNECMNMCVEWDGHQGVSVRVRTRVSLRTLWEWVGRAGCKQVSRECVK